jgi:PAS domain S-box-containing protein
MAAADETTTELCALRSRVAELEAENAALRRRAAGSAIALSPGEREEIHRQARTADLEATNEKLRTEMAEREWAEAALRRSEDKFRRLVENLRREYVFYAHGPDGVFTYVSPSVKEVLGYSPEEFLTHYSQYLTDNPINQEVVEHTNLSLQGLQQPPYEAEIFHRDGGRHTLEVLEFPVLDAEGRVIAVEGLAHDVTASKQAVDALRQSEEKYRALIEATATGYLILDETGTVLDANAEYVRLAGCQTLEEIKGRQVSEWTAPHDRERNRQELENCLTRGFVDDFEVDYIDQAGRVTPIEVNARVVSTPGGRQVLSLCRDISARKRMEEALRQSEATYRSIFNAISDPVLLIDVETGDVVDVNSRAATLLEYRPGDARALRDVQDTKAPPYAAADWMGWIRRACTEGPQTFEWLARKKSGELFWAEAHLERAQIAGHSRVLALVHDISARKQVEEALRQSEESYRRLAEASPDIIFSINRDLTVRYTNERGAQMLGLTLDQIVGRPESDLFPPELSARHTASLRKVFETGTPMVVDQPDHKVFLETRLVPIKDEAGKVTSVLGISRDITERKRTEEALIRAERLAAVGTLTAGVAHEYNNIHTSVIGFLHLVLQSKNLPEAERKIIARAHGAACRAAGVTRNLLAFSQAGRSTRRRCHLQDVVRDTIKLVQGDFLSDGVEITVLHLPAPALSLNEGELAQVVLNLLINARHSLLGRSQKQIQVETGGSDGRSYLRVSDTGCGIPEENLGKLFLPFFTTKGEHASSGSPLSQVKGTGLGLSVCDTLVRNHGGEIIVSSEVGVGSTFTVWLPVGPAGAELKGSPGQASPSPDRPARILVLDDERDVRDLVMSILEPLGYVVLAAEDGSQAVALHEARPFDVALVDLRMPGMGGVSFIQAMKKLPPEVQPVCLVLSGKFAEPSEDGYAGLGVFDAIQKPFSVEQLQERIQAAQLSRSSPAPADK